MILMVFKLYVYKSRVSDLLNFNIFSHQLVKVKKLKTGAYSAINQNMMLINKWSTIQNFCNNKKSFVIHNMNNNSLIETGNSGRELVIIAVFIL